ncbi:MAG: glycosyl transferase, partial [Glaciihabitans sp.]|nr:glycosyl transferase [Glaciihabitans sp.]
MTTAAKTPLLAHDPNRGTGRLGSDGLLALRRGSSWLLRGPDSIARWERPALLGLLALTAVLYVWNLGASGWANSFYSAAVQAGTQDWTAFFYGSSDAANSITVDKPPASLWLMALSARIFGLSSWSVLLPEALMGVATVGVLYATVRRGFSARTALLAGGVLAVTPVAALMFRFNNPDALLVLLLALAVYFILRGIETGAIKWVALAGVMVGFGFLTKQLQAFLVLPVLAGVYLYASRRTLRTRFGHLFAALGAVLVSAGWWVAIVELVPEGWRPYIGGSQTNSFLELTFGYNGLGRLTGDETGSVTGGGTRTATWGETGLLRLFGSDFGGQVTWLLPAALVLAVGGIILLWKKPRLDLQRVTLLLMAGTLVVTAVAFSLMAGIFHAYYTVALAPALAATVAMGASLLWEKRDVAWARIIQATTVLGTGLWAWVLLSRSADWLPWLKFVVLALAIVAAVLLMIPRRGRALAAATLAVTITAALLGPFAFTIQTISIGHTGSIVTAGPGASSSSGGRGAGQAAGAPAPTGVHPGTRAGAPTGTNAGTAAGTGTAPGARSIIRVG